MTKKKMLIKNTLILGIGKLSTQLVSFLLLPLYTIYLSTSDYGFADLALTYVYLLAPTVSLQMEMAVFRFLVSSRADDNRKREIISNAFQIVCFVIFCLVVIFFILNIFINIKYGWYVILNICVAIFANFLLQVTRGLGDNKKYANASIITGIATLIFAILFVVILKLGVIGMLASVAIANVACSIYIFVSLKLATYINQKHDANLKKELVAYSLPLVPNGVSFWVVSLSDRTVVAILIGVAANGIYAVANKFSMILMGVFSIFNMSLTESISLHIKDAKSGEFISDVFNSAIKIFSYLGLILLAIVPFLFMLFIDNAFLSAIGLVPMIIISCILNIVISMYGAIYVAQKQTIKVANTTIIAAVLNVTLTITLVSFFGLYGTVFASILSYFVLMCLRYFDIKKSVNIRYNKTSIMLIVINYTLACIIYCLNSFVLYAIYTIFILVMSILACRSELGVAIGYIKEKFYNSKKNELK